MVRTPSNRSPCSAIRPSATSIENSRGSSPSFDLVPAQRRRDRRARVRPHRVDRRDRLPLAVLVRVDQDAAPLRLRPLGRDQPAVRPRQRRRDDRRELARLLVRVPPLDRDEHVHPVAAARLREPDEPERVEDLLDEQRDLDHLREAGIGGRVEVEEDEVGPVGLVDPRVPRVQVDTAHVHHPEQRELVVDERRLDRPRPPRLSREVASTATVGIQSGMCCGASFWKKCPPLIPSG